MVTPTQKPVPSSEIKDLLFNSGLLDEWATSLEREYIDRFGNSHLTAAGMEWIFNEMVEKFKVDMDEAIRAAGYVFLDSFQQGVNLPNNQITLRNQAVRDERNGNYYRWNGTLPKPVPAGSTPESTGGIFSPANLTGLWVGVVDGRLRDDLASNGGAGEVGTASGLTVEQRFTGIDASMRINRSQAESIIPNSARAIARIDQAKLFQRAGSLCILGDSITDKQGATTLAGSYASIVFSSLAASLNGGYGPDNEVIFNWTSAGTIALSGQTQGTAGPIQRSMIIAVNGTISIDRNANMMGFFYERKPTAGKVEVRQNGVLLQTIDCAGETASNVQSPYVTLLASGPRVQFKVIGAPVEFLAIIPIMSNAKQPNVMMPMRMAVPGWNTTDFLQDPAQLVSVGACGGIGGTDSIFILAIGTNDIYTEARPPADYAANLRTIGTRLESFRASNVIVLVVPPVANRLPAIPQYTHDDYKRAVYELGTERGWMVIDHSKLKLAERGLYTDKLHPGDRGHQEMASNILNALNIPIKTEEKVSDVMFFRKRAALTSFTQTTAQGVTTRTLSLTSMGVTSSDVVTGVYLKWKTSGVMIPYQDCRDLQNNLGIQMLRSFAGAEYSVANLLYRSPSTTDGSGFAAAIGPLSGSILPDYTDVEVVVEFIRTKVFS